MRFFDRKWRVTVGTLQSSDIDLTFDIKRTLTTAPGVAEIEIFNLTEQHRQEIRSSHSAFVRLEAGYADAMPIIFQGNARRIDIRRDQTNWITKVTAGDGEKALRTARLGRSFASDARLADLVNYIGQAFGLGTGNLLDALGSRGLDRVGDAFPCGVVAHGPAAARLTRLLASAGLTWSVQDGVIQALPFGTGLGRAAISIDADHGMIDSPEVGKGGVVTVSSLLQPDLVPGQLVSLTSQVISGTYRIEKVDISGDTKSEPWTAAMDLRLPAPVSTTR